ncbi:MAG TPA: hypothetical protein PLJ21_00380 [Pseudobdellovibrionaceae bacterium]|nr:hypothetical protein [Pseudobdellovibrionaceae bacterium]
MQHYLKRTYRIFLDSKTIVVYLLLIGLLTENTLALPICRPIIQEQTLTKKSIPAELVTGELSLEKIQRLTLTLEGLTTSQRVRFFRVFSSHNLSKLKSQIESGRMPPDLLRFVEQNPLLEVILLDLIALNQYIPGGLKTYVDDSAEILVMRWLKQQEQNYSNHQYLSQFAGKGRVLGESFQYSITQTLRNLIESATLEYQGINFKSTIWERMGNRIGRFFFPLYGRVKDVIDVVQTYQRQLDDMLAVDAVVEIAGIREASRYHLTETEVQKLLNLKLDTPEQMDQILKDLRHIFGESLDYTNAINVMYLKIRTIQKKIDGINIDKAKLNHDDNEIKSLDEMNRLLNLALKRLNKPPRTEKEYLSKELQLYFDGFSFRVTAYRHSYLSFTEKTSNESYTVERRRTESVPDGKDSQGNTKYKTRVYYEDDTVYPSYETILSGNYDTGDRFVSGLDSIKDRTSQMTKNERPYRKQISEVEQLISEIVDSYSASTLTDKQKKEILKNLNRLTLAIEITLPQLKLYSKWTESQIRSQYSNDETEIFRGRNEWMVKRLENSIRLMKVLAVQIEKGEKSLSIPHSQNDYSDWLAELKSYRNKNYAIKTTLGVTNLGTGVGYIYSPEFKSMIDGVILQIPFLSDLLQKSF